MKISHLLSGLAAAAALCLWAGAASAQDAPATAAAACPAQANGAEIHCIGDWAVRCFTNQGTTRCDMFEAVDDRSGQPVASMSITNIPSANKRAIQVLVPLGVSIQKGMQIVTDSYTTPVMPYRSCDRNGCYVAMLIEDPVLAKLGSAGPNAEIRIVADATARTVNANFSLKGFSQALDLMTQLSKAKAGAAAPAKPAAPAP